ncbi:hypothetical protein [Hyphococcus luteus]|uniref:Fimbrial protein n=1 Tax=Hyphococcus luteus TaxID=2058213 RepID=A0A2S7K7Q9_9PROT|nr:hypothetical protein [Marinicaulis flavus]PQA88526.1 hypothetical protein CW354_09580 [Marinicaulis flavus]
MSEQENSQQETQPDPGFGGLAQSIGARNLWIVILAMPAVFLVVVAAIIAVFGKPRGAEGTQTEAPAAESVAATPVSQPLPAGIAIPAGAAPGAIALDGDRLAVRLDGPDGAEVVIYDLAKSEVVARVPFKRED